MLHVQGLKLKNMSAIEQMLKRKASMAESVTLGGGTVAGPNPVKSDQPGVTDPKDTVKETARASSKQPSSTKRVTNKSSKSTKSSRPKTSKNPKNPKNPNKSNKPPARVLTETKKLLEKAKLKTGGVQTKRAKSSPVDARPDLPMDEDDPVVPVIQVDSHKLAPAHLLDKYNSTGAKQRAFVQIAMQMGGLTLTHSESEKLLQQLEETTSEMAAANLTETDVMRSVQQMSDLLMHSPHNNLSTVTDADLINVRTNTAIVRREWEERFLHEPSGCERACCNKASKTCFAGLIENHGITDPNFALCEFYTEAEYTELERNGWCWPEELRPCLLCLRSMIFYQLMHARCNNNQVLSSVSFAPIGNLVGVQGEYCLENCFTSRPDRYEGVLVPVVIPNVMDYKVVTQNGLRYLQQLLPYPGSFATNFFF